MCVLISMHRNEGTDWNKKIKEASQGLYGQFR